MFDNLDIDKLEAEDAKKKELKETYGDISPEEIELSKMREGFMKETNEDNVRSLDRLENNLSEVSDSKPLISEDIERLSEEDKKTESEEEEIVEEEESSEQLDNDEKNDEVVDVNSDTNKSPNEDWQKEKEDIFSVMKQKDELLLKVIQEMQQKNTPTQEANIEDKSVKADEQEDIVLKAKEIIKDISYANEEEASVKLAELLKSLSKPKEVDLDEQKFEEMLAKREQKKYVEKFNTVKQEFFQTDDGKKLLADDDLFDLYQTKFNRLQQSGKHLNPEDLFKQAYESTMSIFSNVSKPSSSMASKPVPKVSDSLKDDVSKVEDTKKQAVKPSSSSNAGKPAENKKFDPIHAYKEYLKSIGQTI